MNVCEFYAKNISKHYYIHYILLVSMLTNVYHNIYSEIMFKIQNYKNSKSKENENGYKE